MLAYIQTLGRFSREVRLFLVSSALMGFCVFGGIYSVLFNLYLLRLGYGPEYIGAANAVGFLSTAVFAMLGVAISNRLGIRRALILGMTLAVLGYALLPLGEALPGRAPDVWILALYMFAHFGLTIYLVSANPFLMAATLPAERSHAFSVQVAVWPLSGFAGSLLGGALPAFFAGLLGHSLDSPVPYRFPLLLAASLLTLAIVALYALREVKIEELPESHEMPANYPLAIMLIMAAVGFLRVVGEGVGRTFFNVYLDDALGVPTVQIGTMLAFAQLLAAPIALFAPYFVRRFGNRNLLGWGTLVMAAAILPLALVPHWLGAGLGLVGILGMSSLVRPAYMMFTQEIVHPRWRTSMSGITTLAVGLSWGTVAFGGGFIIANLGYPMLFLLATGLTGAGALVFTLFARRISDTH